MAGARVAAADGGSDRSGLVWVVVARLIGVAAILSGGAVVVIVVQRLFVYSANGGVLTDAGSVWAITWVALLTVVAGISILTVAWRREPRPTPPWIVAGGGGLALSLFAPLALVIWYPANEHATVIAYDMDSGDVLWKTTTPVTELSAITVTADGLAAVGRIDDG